MVRVARTWSVADAPVRLVGQHGAPLVAGQRAAGDPAGEPLQRRAVDRPLARRADLGEEQAAVGLEGDLGDPARDLGEVVADALVRAQVPQRRLSVPVGRRQQPSVRGDGDLGHVRGRDLDRRLALAAGLARPG